MRNDFVPEEKAQAYNHLLTALRSFAPGRAPITTGEQTQIIARVRERLARATSTPALPDVGTLPAQHPFVPHLVVRQARTSTRVAAQLLAALVVIALIFGSWALFRASPFAHRVPVSPAASAPGPSTQAQTDGLEASIHVLISGPYFLRELLPIDVSFTNHTQKPAGLDGSLRIANNTIANACFPAALLVQITQGGNPSYMFPQLGAACLQPYVVTEVEPGQTLTIHQYVPLTRSGDVTLARGDVPPDGDPLDRRWPTIHLHVQVNPQIPQGRALALQSQGTQVMISAPAGAKAHLLSMQSVSCDGYGGLGNPGQWTPLSTSVLYEPACPAPHRHWTYVVSAPGYAIVSGSA